MDVDELPLRDGCRIAVAIEWLSKKRADKLLFDIRQ